MSAASVAVLAGPHTAGKSTFPSLERIVLQTMAQVYRGTRDGERTSPVRHDGYRHQHLAGSFSGTA